MPVFHLDINISTDYSVKNTIKVGGNVVNEAYFSRHIISINPKPSTSSYVLVTLLDGTIYILTHDQTNEDPAVFIVDNVEGVPPTGLLDLAAKLNAITKF